MGTLVGGREKGLRPAVAFVGRSGAGKTTLLERLVPALEARGLRVGYLKGTHHERPALGRPGKDTDRLFRAGARRALITSATEALLRVRVARRDAHALLAEHFGDCDVVLVEGFKGSDLPRIEVRHGAPLLAEADVLAVVSDEPDARAVPRFRRDDIGSLAGFLAGRMCGRP